MSERVLTFPKESLANTNQPLKISASNIFCNSMVLPMAKSFNQTLDDAQ